MLSNRKSVSTILTRFPGEETGAVTVDWVVLTAALVGLGIAVMAVVSGGVEDISDEMGQTLTDTSVEFTYFGQNVFDYAANASDQALFDSRVNSLNAMQARGATPEQMSAAITDNVDHAVYWGMRAANDGNQAAMQAQIDYVLATEQFATANGYQTGVSTVRNPNVMTSADFIAARDAQFGT